MRVQRHTPVPADHAFPVLESPGRRGLGPAQVQRALCGVSPETSVLPIGSILEPRSMEMLVEIVPPGA